MPKRTNSTNGNHCLVCASPVSLNTMIDSIQWEEKYWKTHTCTEPVCPVWDNLASSCAFMSAESDHLWKLGKTGL